MRNLFRFRTTTGYPRRLNKLSSLVLLLVATSLYSAPSSPSAISATAIITIYRQAAIYEEVDILKASERSIDSSIFFSNQSARVVRVPTGGFTPKIVFDKGTLKIDILYDYRMSELGKEIIPAESLLNVVSLQPGEAAELFYKTKLPEDLQIEAIELNYIVTKRFGERFKLWYGKIVPKLDIRGGLNRSESGRPKGSASQRGQALPFTS